MPLSPRPFIPWALGRQSSSSSSGIGVCTPSPHHDIYVRPCLPPETIDVHSIQRRNGHKRTHHHVQYHIGYYHDTAHIMYIQWHATWCASIHGMYSSDDEHNVCKRLSSWWWRWGAMMILWDYIRTTHSQPKRPPSHEETNTRVSRRCGSSTWPSRTEINRHNTQHGITAIVYRKSSSACAFVKCPAQRREEPNTKHPHQTHNVSDIFRSAESSVKSKCGRFCASSQLHPETWILETRMRKHQKDEFLHHHQQQKQQQ